MCIQSENYGDFRRMCNPRPNYVHFTGGKLRHGDSPHFLWGKHLQCNYLNNHREFFLASVRKPTYKQNRKIKTIGSRGFTRNVTNGLRAWILKWLLFIFWLSPSRLANNISIVVTNISSCMLEYNFVYVMTIRYPWKMFTENYYQSLSGLRVK